MSTLETNLVQPSTGTTLTLGASGDTVDVPSGATLDVTGATVTGLTTGKVLQVVNNSSSTNVSTSSTTSQSILTASITPNSSSNKILVLAGLRISITANSNAYAGSILYRGTTSGTNISDQAIGDSNNADFLGFIKHIVLDSPSTTSSQTYTLGFRKAYSNTTSASTDSQLYDITLLEIEA